MKKILFWILTFLWIWFSFCSADTVSWFSTSNNPVYNSSFSIIYDPYNFNLTWNIDRYNKCYNRTFSNRIYDSSIVFITWDNISSISLTSLCVPFKVFSDWDAFININWVSYSLPLPNSSYFSCLDFSENPILLTGFSFSYYIYWSSFPSPIIYWICTYPYDFYFSDSSVNWNYYFKINDNLFFTSNFVHSSSVNTVWLPFSFSLNYELISPKLKVNYGSTLYEYELSDNLSIYLKSPVIQNWTTFTYAWSTWINLYFNGSSQFYSKDKLYLNTPSWYNNNIFTPICL